MGLRHGREYEDIIKDFTVAILLVPEFYDFLGITNEEWIKFDSCDQQNIVKTLADDLFYGLDEEPRIEIGRGVVEYIDKEHLIKVFVDDSVVKIVNLI